MHSSVLLASPKWAHISLLCDSILLTSFPFLVEKYGTKKLCDCFHTPHTYCGGVKLEFISALFWNEKKNILTTTTIQNGLQLWSMFPEMGLQDRVRSWSSFSSSPLIPIYCCLPHCGKSRPFNFQHIASSWIFFLYLTVEMSLVK